MIHVTGRLVCEKQGSLGPILAPTRRGVHVFRNNCPAIATTTRRHLHPRAQFHELDPPHTLFHSTSAVSLRHANLPTLPLARSVTILQLPTLPRDSSSMQLLTFYRQTRTNTRNPSANHERLLRIRARRQGICRRTCVFPARAAQKVNGSF